MEKKSIMKCCNIFVSIVMTLLASASVLKAQEVYELPEFDVTFYSNVDEEMQAAFKDPRMDRFEGRITQSGSATFAKSSSECDIFMFTSYLRDSNYLYSAIPPSPNMTVPSYYVDAKFSFGSKLGLESGVVAVVFSNTIATPKDAIKAVKAVNPQDWVDDIPDEAYLTAQFNAPYSFREWVTKKSPFKNADRHLGNQMPKEDYKAILDDFEPNSYKYRFIIIFECLEDNDYNPPKIGNPLFCANFHDAVRKGDVFHGGKIINPFLGPFFEEEDDEDDDDDEEVFVNSGSIKVITIDELDAVEDFDEDGEWLDYESVKNFLLNN